MIARPKDDCANHDQTCPRDRGILDMLDPKLPQEFADLPAPRRSGPYPPRRLTSTPTKRGAPMLRIGAVLASADALTAPWACRGAVILTEVSPINVHTYHMLSQSNGTDAEADAATLGGHLVAVT